MSTSEKQAAEELKDALEYGRCRVCDGIQCEGLEGSCTCCARCGNPDASCVCCPHCGEDLSFCKCYGRLKDIWTKEYQCSWCSEDSSLFGEKEWHRPGEPCPGCCAICKEMVCVCCEKCCTTPCICCTGCGDLRIKCKCWAAKILSHFMRRARYNHAYQQKLQEVGFPANTAALITVNTDYE
jgi:hypothetical protein